MTEKVFFKFEGSFLTETFRNYYWDGSHTYEESVEYIIQFFVLPTEKDKNYVRTKIAPGILNGTKKLVGEENYDLEDDYLYKMVVNPSKEEIRKLIKRSIGCTGVYAFALKGDMSKKEIASVKTVCKSMCYDLLSEVLSLTYKRYL